MELAAEIRRQIRDYLAGRISIAEFWGWLQEQLWDIDNREPLSAPLAHEVALLLSETAHGDWTEAELRERLTPEAAVYEFVTERSTVTTTSVGDVRNVIIPGVLQPA